MAKGGYCCVLLVGLVHCLLRFASAAQYEEYILAPAQRDLTPLSVYRTNGSVVNAEGLTEHGAGDATFRGSSAATFDYGKNIGGLVSFVVNSVNGSNNYIGLSFSESSFWISPDGSDATQNVGIDRTLWYPISSAGEYTVENDYQRGGFRYLNVYHNSSGSVQLSTLTTRFTAMPHYPDDGLRDYSGYFHSNDERLNRVWYASAYTNQLCTLPATSGNSLVDLDATNPRIPTEWWSNSTLTNGSSALVDGAKRDKLIWPGDFAISLPGVFLSTNDQYTLKLSVGQLFAEQKTSTGQLPYVATPIYERPKSTFFEELGQTYSYTYHLYNLLGLDNYYVYSGDIDFLKQNWFRVTLALNYSLASVDETGLAYVAKNATADWLRVGMGAHNIEANSILAYTLTRAISLAYAVGDSSQTSVWQSYYDGIVSAANDLLWDEAAGLYTDNATTTLHPQDGNSWAIISGVADSSRSAVISSALHDRWGQYGAPAPEAGTTVSPFISSFELQAHFVAGQPQYAIDLMRFMWADFMLDDPRMTNSTFIEGYDTSGALHYPAYDDDARISHAHGWATGPLIALTNYVAGIHVLNSTNWLLQPQPGDLSSVEAGFETAIGSFSAKWSNESDGGSATYAFETPRGSSGRLVLDAPGCTVSLTPNNGSSAAVQSAHGTWMVDVVGGSYVAAIRCGDSGTPVPSLNKATSLCDAAQSLIVCIAAAVVAIYVYM